ATVARRAFSGGALTVNAINDFGNVTLYSYDGLDRKIESDTLLTPSGKGNGSYAGADLTGVKMTPPSGYLDPTQGGGDGIIRTGYTYDRNSLQSSLIDAQGNVTLYLYDNLDRRVAESQGLTVGSTLTTANVLGPRPVVTPTVATVNNPAAIATTQIDAQL